MQQRMKDFTMTDEAIHDVCSCETNKEGTDRYAKFCTNGPVFYSEEVTLND